MRYVIIILAYFMLSAFTEFSFWSTIGTVIWLWFVVNLFYQVDKSIAFREFILVMYGLNYLFAPALTFQQSEEMLFYKMKLSEEAYFSLAIPAIFLLRIGMYAIKNSMFEINLAAYQESFAVNEKIFKQWLIAGIILSFVRPFIPGELNFVVYLLSSIRYVAAFSLFAIDKKKYKWYLIGILILEIGVALKTAMFHDMVMWLIFFGLFWFYLVKPSFGSKILIATTAIMVFFILQVTKSDYRKQAWSGQEETGLSTFQSSVAKNLTSSEGIFSLDNFLNSLTRANQGWIFASAVNRMNYRKDYQQLELVKKYAEAAFLPRFLAPNKMQAGEKEIFNRFSGARIGQNTSMGLGILADGYIAYSQIGTFLFAFLFGLIIALIFKTINGWTTISPFFVLFIFPLLNYAVRADCETQTIMTHLVKGLLIYSLLIAYYKKVFQKHQMADAQLLYAT